MEIKNLYNSALFFKLFKIKTGVKILSIMVVEMMVCHRWVFDNVITMLIKLLLIIKYKLNK